MKNLQKGFIVPVLLVIIALLVVGGGVYIYKNKKVEVPAADNGTQQTNTQTPPVTTQQNPINNKPTNVAPSNTKDLIIQETKELVLGVTGSHPKFSPNGTKILFESRDKDEGLWTVNIDGSNLENTYKGLLSAVDDYEWSPDGKFVFVVTSLQTNSRFAGSKDEVINIINIQSKDIKQIFGPATNILYPEWISNDEIGFIYENQTSRENFAIFDINGNKKNYQDNGGPVFFYTSDRGTGAGDQSVIKSVTRSGVVKEITDVAFTGPVISPDRTKVLYQQYTGPGNLMTMNFDGSQKITVTTAYGAGDAVWSPSGKMIAYSVEKDNGLAILEWDIYAINADGTGKIKLTNSGKKFASHPRWSPDGKKLVFDYNETGKIGLLIFK